MEDPCKECLVRAVCTKDLNCEKLLKYYIFSLIKEEGWKLKMKKGD